MEQSLLKDGKIPAGKECPFKEICSFRFDCFHFGTNHEIDYSCAWARGFDLLKRNDAVKQS